MSEFLELGDSPSEVEYLKIKVAGLEERLVVEENAVTAYRRQVESLCAQLAIQSQTIHELETRLSARERSRRPDLSVKRGAFALKNVRRAT